jgi:DNA helicase-2/ATP-dependent DNA helicase PcrA
VAMTRARDLLVLSWFNQYKQKNAEPSRFIKDLVRGPNKEHLRKIGECCPARCSRKNGDQGILLTDFGRILTFTECPYKYYLRHLCGFQPPIAPELGYGKALHHVVAELARQARNSEKPSASAVEEILSASFYLPFAGPNERGKLYKAAERRLLNYVTSHGHELVRTIEPERRFEVPIASARVRGRVDLLLKAENGRSGDVELIDFKTSANRPPSEQHTNQLRLYAEAIRALGMNPVRLAIHDLDADHGGRIDVEESDREKAEFRAELQQWLEEIRANHFLRARKDAHCSKCDFGALC